MEYLSNSIILYAKEIKVFWCHTKIVIKNVQIYNINIS